MSILCFLLDKLSDYYLVFSVCQFYYSKYNCRCFYLSYTGFFGLSWKRKIGQQTYICTRMWLWILQGDFFFAFCLMPSSEQTHFLKVSTYMWMNMPWHVRFQYLFTDYWLLHLCIKVILFLNVGMCTPVPEMVVLWVGASSLKVRAQNLWKLIWGTCISGKY